MAKPSERDPYADFLRACSLLVVILYHWCFTILIWDDGITSATNPLAYQSGIWILSWVLQVVPIFFYIGSYVHLRSWERASARGETLPRFAFRQARSLFIPSMTLVVAWSVLGVLISTTFDLDWVVFAVFLVLSPLWFVLVYLFFVCAMPVTVWLHRRFDSLVLVVLAALAVIVDLLRLRFGVPAVEWVNMLFVWGFAYQLGYFHGRISGFGRGPSGRRRTGRLDVPDAADSPARLGSDARWPRRGRRPRVLRRLSRRDGRRAGPVREHGSAHDLPDRADDLPGRRRRTGPARGVARAGADEGCSRARPNGSPGSHCRCSCSTPRGWRWRWPSNG